MFGATEEPYLQDFQVGPLPKPTTYAPLSYYATSAQGSKIKNYDADSDAVYDFVYENILSEVQDIVMDLVSSHSCAGFCHFADAREVSATVPLQDRKTIL